MNRSMSTVPYAKILFEELQIPPEFFRGHKDIINDKLRQAAADLGRQHGDILAINQCVNLASSIVLRNASHLDPALDYIHRTSPFENRDAATVVTVATLYYLLSAEVQRHRHEVLQTEIERIRKRFDEINWLIGPEGMMGLGIDRRN